MDQDHSGYHESPDYGRHYPRRGYRQPGYGYQTPSHGGYGRQPHYGQQEYGYGGYEEPEYGYKQRDMEKLMANLILHYMTHRIPQK